jgi:hypothetical protein
MPTNPRFNGKNHSQLPDLISDTMYLKDLPQTSDAPTGYGNVAAVVNGLVDAVEFNPLAFQVSAIQPTVTVSAAGAATSITNSVRIQPMRSTTNAAKFAVDGDPNFRITGVPSSKTFVDASDIMRTEHLTGGSPQAARWRPYVEFTHTGQQFELFMRVTGTNTRWRLWINGRPMTAGMQTLTSTGGSRHRILVDFGSVGVRDIRFEMQEFSFGGVFVEPFGSITAANYSRKRFVVISDSTGAGATSDVSPFDSWPWFTANYLGMDCINIAIGGSGYIAAPSFQSRLQDVIDANPDYLFVAGGWNDLQGNTTTAIMNAYSTFVASVAAALPNCKIIVGGVHMNSQNDYPLATDLEVALRTAATASGYPFVSQRDPEGVVASLPAWANGVPYKFGDTIAQNGLPFTCHTEHTSSGSFDATKFRCTALYSGTGRVGATAGNGNLDICLTNDSVHFSQVGMLIQSINYAEQIVNKL